VLEQSDRALKRPGDARERRAQPNPVTAHQSEEADMTHAIEITVKRSARGNWEVYESGFEAPLAEFADREDAIDYARGIAATKARASIDAEPDADMPGVRESYALDPVSGKSHRLTA
jgi:hypothetical protein